MLTEYLEQILLEFEQSPIEEDKFLEVEILGSQGWFEFLESGILTFSYPKKRPLFRSVEADIPTLPSQMTIMMKPQFFKEKSSITFDVSLLSKEAIKNYIVAYVTHFYGDSPKLTWTIKPLSEEATLIDFN